MGFKLMAGAVASCALIGVAVGVGTIYGSLLISIVEIRRNGMNCYDTLSSDFHWLRSRG